MQIDNTVSADNVLKSDRMRGVRHAFFGRVGGVSSGLFSSLNCSRFVGDDRDSVEHNLEIVKNFVGAKSLITMNQVHGADCVLVNEDSSSDFEADAIITKAHGIALGILTADCVPVLFFDEKAGIIGAAHAGWKGAVAGVIENTVAKIVELGGEDIVAAIGPCVHRESFEVSEDFIERFQDKSKYFFWFDNRSFFDLPMYCRDKLINAGVKSVDVIDTDTVRNHDKYFSFRYAKKTSNGVCGRNISLICL